MSSETTYSELIIGNEYIIKNDTIHKGIFIQKISYTGSKIIPIEKRTVYEQWYEIVTIWYMLFNIDNETKYFFENDKYYDVNIIKNNAIHARQQMENRSLNLILKRLINENFEW